MISLKNAVLFLLENAAKYGDTVHAAGAQSHIGHIQNEFSGLEAIVQGIATRVDAPNPPAPTPEPTPPPPPLPVQEEVHRDPEPEE